MKLLIISSKENLDTKLKKLIYARASDPKSSARMAISTNSSIHTANINVRLLFQKSIFVNGINKATAKYTPINFTHSQNPAKLRQIC